jgi:hypothetical protein
MVLLRESQDGDPYTEDRRPQVSEPHPAMRLLRAGIPLSLLLDLADPSGPDTWGIMQAERRAGEAGTPSRPRALAAVGVAGVPGELADPS